MYENHILRAEKVAGCVTAIFGAHKKEELPHFRYPKVGFRLPELKFRNHFCVLKIPSTPYFVTLKSGR